MSMEQTEAATQSSQAQQAHHHPKSNGDASACITAEDRRQMIALGAYYRAESRGFAPGYELEDWFEAESEVDDALGDAAASA